MKLLLLAGAFATLADRVSAQWGCYSLAYGQQIVAEYQAIIAQQPSDLGNATETAEQIIAEGYAEYSDSALTINGHTGIPLGQPITSSKEAFIEESQSNPAFVTTTLNIYVACNVITWEWVALTLGSAVYEVKGIHILQLNSDGQIASASFEFNNIAAALDTGYEVINITSGAPLVVIPQ